MRLEISTATTQGPRRYQEDRCSSFKLKPYFKHIAHVLAVMDGHSGSEVAILCEDELAKIFSAKKFLSPEKLLKEVVAELATKTSGMVSGSTISIALVLPHQKKVVISILGDSPIIVKGRDGSIFVSPEHNVRTNQVEREEAVRRGGFYMGGYICDCATGSGLQLSRALGDTHLGNIISRLPYITTINIKGGSFVLVCSDGLIDPSHKSQDSVPRIIELIEQGANAEQLIIDAEQKGLRDNASAVLCRVL